MNQDEFLVKAGSGLSKQDDLAYAFGQEAEIYFTSRRATGGRLTLAWSRQRLNLSGRWTLRPGVKTRDSIKI